jgi:hypothetical protein
MIHIKERPSFYFNPITVRKPGMSGKPWPLTLKAITFFSPDSLHFSASSMAQRVGKYMIRPLLSLECLSFDEKEGKVCYQYGEDAEEVERTDYLEFIARVVSHIPDKGQVTVRYYGLCKALHKP